MKILQVTRNGKAYGYRHWCPACKSSHIFAVEQPNVSNGAKWTFDGNVDSPTFAPSMLIYTTNGHWSEPPNSHWVEGTVRKTVCHYFLKKGVLEYQADSLHILAGVTVPLPDFPLGEVT